MKQIADIRIDERTTPQDHERIRRDIVEAVREQQKQPVVQVIKEGLELADGIATPVPHSLGRRVLVWTSAVRGAVSTGRIEEVRDGSYDYRQFIVLKASDWGASITIDVFGV